VLEFFCDFVRSSLSINESHATARRQDEQGESGRYRAMYLPALSGQQYPDVVVFSFARWRLRPGHTTTRRCQSGRTDDSRSRQSRQQRQSLVRENDAGEQAWLSAIYTVFHKKTWQYFCDHNSFEFYNFCTALSRKNIFTHHLSHVNYVLTLPCENQTSHFILL